tara:strand:- start:391 stop:693 length:303 start_codon:yes stop_codon:yes gene_type:complete
MSIEVVNFLFHMNKMCRYLDHSTKGKFHVELRPGNGPEQMEIVLCQTINTDITHDVVETFNIVSMAELETASKLFNRMSAQMMEDVGPKARHNYRGYPIR